MAETSIAGKTTALLASLTERLGLHDEAGRRTLRRGIYGAAVALVHILFLYLLILSQWMPVNIDLLPKHAPLVWIPLMQKNETPKVAPPTPKRESQQSSAASILRPTVIRPEEENNAIDWGLAIGRALACGANNYEYLSSRQRSACLRRPWNFVYDRYGDIVLDATPRPAQVQDRPRPSDVQARERYTAPQCPKNIDPNAPCLSAIVGDHP